ncbi:MAG: hypothetical protein IT368_04815 [Candidatus Hydrogenedentes bacterium]|nr:hypothetical protein [Candidatus Hydrogenedentota bacterium]
MTAKMKRMRRQSLFGWIKWIPVIAVPFSVLFCEAWLNTQTRFVDYSLVRVNNRINEVKASLDRVRVEEARLQSFDRLAVEAPDLGLQPAAPEQVLPIYYSERTGEVFVPDRPFIMARLEAERKAAGETVPLRKAGDTERRIVAAAQAQPAASTILIAPAPPMRQETALVVAEVPAAAEAPSPANIDGSVASLLGAL